MENLHQTFTDNKVLLGPNWENLGQTVGKGLTQKKILLSYSSSEKQWNIVKLNLFQQFIRKFFGFYKDTHLKHVIQFWRNHKVGKKNFDQVLDRKLIDLWQKTYPKKKLPSFAHYYSNQKDISLNNVELFLFGEKHTKTSHSKFIGEVINQYYRPGDLILVEQRGDKPISVKTCGQLKYVRRRCLVKGWDPLTRKDEIFEVTKPVKLARKIQQSCRNFLDQFPRKGKFSPKDLNNIEKAIDPFIKEIEPHFGFFFDKTQEKEQIRSELRKIKNLVHQGSVKNSEQLKNEILQALKPLHAKANKMKYHYMTREGVKIVDETVGMRNAALAKAIQENCKPGRRVFVIAGALHLCISNTRNRKLQTNIGLVKEAIKRHNFILATPKKMGKRLNIKASNPDFVKIANPFREKIPLQF